jgi:hypothetical protein
MKKEPVISLHEELDAYENIDMSKRVAAILNKGWIEKKLVNGRGNQTFLMLTRLGNRVAGEVTRRLEESVKEFQQKFAHFGKIQDLELKSPLAISVFKSQIKEKDLKTRGHRLK